MGFGFGVWGAGFQAYRLTGLGFKGLAADNHDHDAARQGLKQDHVGVVKNYGPFLGP